MRARIVIPLALMGLFSVGSAYAMTSTQAKQLAIAAGHGNAADLAKLESAAKSGDAEAENSLGNVYYYGEGVPQDSMTAITWWKKAAAHGGRAGRLAQQNINMAERG